MTSRIVYGWKEARGFKVSAQIVGEELEAIEQKHGEVTPKIIVDQARPIASPLHSFFEWNDRDAAEHYRHDQARNLVSCIVVKAYDGEETRTPTRAFVSVSDVDGRSYMGIATAMSDKDVREQLLERGRREIIEWRERYRALQEFSKVFSAIDKIAAPATAKRGRQRTAQHVAAA